MPILPFYKLSPGGNTTVLLAALHLPPAEQCLVAQQALTPQHLGGEQAGFVCLEKGLLRMAGGEFCLNATRCLGYLLAMRDGFFEAPFASSAPKIWRGTALVSGLPEAVHMEVSLHDEVCHVAVMLPLNPPPVPRIVQEGCVLVALPGITHVLLDQDTHPFPAAHWREAAAHWRAHLRLGPCFEQEAEQAPPALNAQEESSATGCVWWRSAPPPLAQEQERDMCFLAAEPVIAVRHPRTECHEQACGSGALALALARHSATGQRNFSIMQPGGSALTVRLEERGTQCFAVVGGPVSLVAQGQAYFQPLPR